MQTSYFPSVGQNSNFESLQENEIPNIHVSYPLFGKYVHRSTKKKIVGMSKNQ